MEIITLRKATFYDWKFLLDWRNDIETRKNSHNMAIVEAENHKKWLNSVLSNENRQLFIALENNIPVGTVRADFDKSNNEYEISWTISPIFRGKGIGKKMVKLLSDKLQAKIRAEIKKGNISSVKIAEFAGMTSKKEENGVLHYSNNKKL
jgi:RimJ/RimL family protein N-acetyltransferase